MLLPITWSIDAVMPQSIAHFPASEISDTPKCSEKFSRWTRNPRLHAIKKMTESKFHPLVGVALNRFKQGYRMFEHRLEAFPGTVSSYSPGIASLGYSNQRADFRSYLGAHRAWFQVHADCGNKPIEILFRDHGHFSAPGGYHLLRRGFHPPANHIRNIIFINKI